MACDAKFACDFAVRKGFLYVSLASIFEIGPFLPCGFGKTAAARSRNLFMASVQNRLSHRRCEITATSLRFSNFCPTFFLKKNVNFLSPIFINNR